jgi:hypothetical protein
MYGKVIVKSMHTSCLCEGEKGVEKGEWGEEIKGEREEKKRRYCEGIWREK